MDVQIAYISPRPGLKSAGAKLLVDGYVRRSQRFASVLLANFRNEAALFESATRRSGRTKVAVMLLDSRGQALTSPQIAEQIGNQRDAGTQEMVLAIGPPDGWSVEARQKAHSIISFGAITLPHELALVVASEQLYRAFTILAGHPYHAGHE